MRPIAVYIMGMLLTPNVDAERLRLSILSTTSTPPPAPGPTLLRTETRPPPIRRAAWESSWSPSLSWPDRDTSMIGSGRASSVASSGTCKSVGVFRNNDLAGWWLRRRMWRQVEILPQQMLPQQLLAEASRPVAGADVVVIDAMDPRDTPLVLDVGAPRASSPAPPRHHERRGWSPPPG